MKRFQALKLEASKISKWVHLFWFQSGALFLASCYILAQKHELFWILQLKFAICTVHRFFHGVHRFTQSLHRFSIVFIELAMGSIDFPWFHWVSMHSNMHLVNMYNIGWSTPVLDLNSGTGCYHRYHSVGWFRVYLGLFRGGLVFV